MDFIFIDDMRVEAHVGIYDRERAAPQTLDLTLTFGVPDEAAQDDDIAKTIDYAVVIAARSRRTGGAAFQPARNTGRIPHRPAARRVSRALGQGIDRQGRHRTWGASGVGVQIERARNPA